ncbi:MAG: GTP 3',8-cyclase MoaA, partial [Chloroflexi bacterium]|nr:GTP 3',8-cyclase MoaA [Chloroflexota bacterium]
ARPLHDLRISVTDRCNFRCVYCMPKEVFGRGYRFLPKDDLLTYEEIARLVGISMRLGVTKVRLTGGEPLTRRGIEDLVAMLARDGLDLALTTNGSLLEEKARALRDAGLTRISVSLDSLDDAVFRRMNDVDFPVERVVRAMDAAYGVGLHPLKVNMVVRRGMNEESIVPMAAFFRERGYVLRFIEYMDVGHTNGWCMDDVVSAKEIVRAVTSAFPAEPAEPNYVGEVAERWRYSDGRGEFGVIASVTQPFCRDCTRARLSADGKLYTCLFATQGTDLQALLRGGASDDEIAGRIADLWSARTDRYSELRGEETARLRKIEMSYIGG